LHNGNNPLKYQHDDGSPALLSPSTPSFTAVSTFTSKRTRQKLLFVFSDMLDSSSCEGETCTARRPNKGIPADVYPSIVDGTHKHKLFGWRYDPALTEDENYMDLASLVARNSLCTGGHMGCVLVKDGGIKAIATNTPLFQQYASDVHAEVNAVSACARSGVATEGATAYITMPPCKHCFMVLQAAGIKRMVSRHETLLSNCMQASEELRITWGVVKDTSEGDRRRDAYVLVKPF
jgi:dCMP deaminase